MFILGTGHCGSTLLDLLLGSHSQGFSLGELSSLCWPSYRMKNKELAGRVCGVCEEACPFWDSPPVVAIQNRFFPRIDANRLRHRLVNRVSSLHGALARVTGQRLLVDSSKNAGWVERQLIGARKWRTLTPVVLYLIRDGRAVVNSRMRKANLGIEEATEEWTQRATRLTDFYEGTLAGIRRYRMSYENLCSSPGDVLKSFLGTVEMDYEPEMLNYGRKDHHPIAGNLGTRSLLGRAGQDRKSYLNAVHADYYEKLSGIKLDERWRTELSEQNLAWFEERAGRLNDQLTSSCGSARS